MKVARLYRYTIRTIDGQRHLVDAADAADAAEAIKKSGIPREQIRPWYPFCIAEITEQDETLSQKKGAHLKQYRDELKESKLQLDKERSTQEVPYAGETNNLPLIPPACDCTENPCDKLHDRDEEIERQADERDLLEPPAVEHLANGEVQILLPTTPTRTVPAAPLRPRRAQNDKPLPLEMPAITAAQGRLF